MLAGIVEQIHVVRLARYVVEINFAVRPLRHRSTFLKERRLYHGGDGA
jgi:hypothetical protein